MRKFSALLLLPLFCAPIYTRSRSHSGTASQRSSISSRRTYSTAKAPRARASRSSKIKCIGCERDSHGRIQRSSKARSDFMRSHPCPATGKTLGPCPGYVVDHIKPLKRGGVDTPSNMQWQTKAASKAKDRIE